MSHTENIHFPNACNYCLPNGGKLLIKCLAGISNWEIKILRLPAALVTAGSFCPKQGIANLKQLFCRQSNITHRSQA